MSTARWYAGIAKNPFPNESVEIVKVSGGSNSQGKLNTGEMRTRNGWISFNTTIPKTIYRHCMSYVNYTTIILIGGHQDDETYSKNTHLLIGDDWTLGPGVNLKIITKKNFFKKISFFQI